MVCIQKYFCYPNLHTLLTSLQNLVLNTTRFVCHSLRTEASLSKFTYLNTNHLLTFCIGENKNCSGTFYIPEKPEK